MPSKEDKIPLPPNAGPPIDHDADQVEVVKELAANQKRLKVGVGIGATVLLLVVIVASLLGVYLAKDNVVTGTRLWKVKEEVLKEKIEVDVEAKTETFYTEAKDGSSALMHDINTGLSAYKFDEQETCYITDYAKDAEDAEEVDNLAQKMEDGKDGEVEVAEVDPKEYLSEDDSREPFDRSSLSDRMDEFCGSLETKWGVKTAEEPEEDSPEANTTSPAEDNDDSGAVAVTEGAAMKRKKRGLVCGYVSRWVCRTVCRNVCGRKKRATEVEKADDDEEAPTRVKRFWGRRRRRRRRRWISCPRICTPVCSWVLTWVCNYLTGGSLFYNG